MIEPIRKIFPAPELKRRVLGERTARCLEGAIFAAALLEASNSPQEPPDPPPLIPDPRPPTLACFRLDFALR